jgi:hypothetical protein
MLRSLPARLLRLAGSPLAILAMVLLAAGTFVTVPITVRDHWHAEPLSYDYLAFDAAGQMVIRGHSDHLYHIPAQKFVELVRTNGGHGTPFFVFLYPPAVAAAATPLSGLSPNDGYLAFVGVMTATLAAGGVLMARLTSDLSRKARWIVTICALGSSALAISLLVGQLTPLLLLSVLSALLLLRADRAPLAGLCLGLLFIKPHLALIALIVALAARQRQLAAAMLGAGAVLTVASLAIVGLQGAQDYLSLTREAATHPAALSIAVPAEQNLSGLVATFFGIRDAASVAIAQAALAVVGLAIAVRAITRNPYAGAERALYVAGVGSLAAIVAAPHVQYYDLAFLLMPALFVAHRGETSGSPDLRRALRGLLVCSIVFVEAAGMLASAKLSISAPVLFGMLVLLSSWPRFEVYFTARSPARQPPATLPAAQDAVDDRRAA